ncbi:ArpU family phage packaging/lysis transcriptional regulator [Listeria booriae]|uniref:ArpU family phage packaging/lysis transcriptional regulator n=1 Tax=Listeria booriae TaxID=1552123 RepID=UPI0016242E0D|nr:ArpU family phage packaging/lysis transcriptional regulator [Listeria booriae]MBC2258155.1 hypothetical protein [Listeria booriae]
MNKCKEAERLLFKYNTLLLSLPKRSMPRRTEDNQLKLTKRIAESTMYNEIRQITDAINKLNGDQREVLLAKYVSQKKRTNIEVYMSIGWSESHYYRLKKAALEGFLTAYYAGQTQAKPVMTH